MRTLNYNLGAVRKRETFSWDLQEVICKKRFKTLLTDIVHIKDPFGEPYILDPLHPVMRTFWWVMKWWVSSLGSMRSYRVNACIKVKTINLHINGVNYQNVLTQSIVAKLMDLSRCSCLYEIINTNKTKFNQR